jgi:hypothetical protein
MSYNNLSSVSATLASHIWENIKNDSVITKIIPNSKQITLQSPKDIPKTTKPQISIYLYNITEIPSLRNQPQVPGENRTLLYLNLQYLITPINQQETESQILLGKIMQIFAQTPVLREAALKESLCDSGEVLRVTLDPLGAEDFAKVWGMLQTPYALSLSYSVRPVRIESLITQQVTSKLVSTVNAVNTKVTKTKVTLKKT